MISVSPLALIYPASATEYIGFENHMSSTSSALLFRSFAFSAIFKALSMPRVKAFCGSLIFQYRRLSLMSPAALEYFPVLSS